MIGWFPVESWVSFCCVLFYFFGGDGRDGGDGSWLSIFHESPTPQVFFFASRIEALVGAISDFATRSRKWLPLPLHSQMPVEQQESSPGQLCT